jgi:hypothetical protein
MLHQLYLYEALVKPIDGLQSLGIRKRQRVRPKPDDIAMLLMQLDVRSLGPLPADIPEPPPVRDGREEGPRVPVQPLVVPLLDDPDHRGGGGDGEPVVAEGGEEGLGDVHFGGWGRVDDEIVEEEGRRRRALALLRGRSLGG